MREEFFEETAFVVEQDKEAKKYKIAKVISIVFYVLTALMLYLTIAGLDVTNPPSGALNIVFFILVNILPIVFLFLMGFFVGRYKKRFYNEYDYTFVSGSFRFSKVIMNSKRVIVKRFESNQVEKMGYYESETCNSYLNNANIKKQILTSNQVPAEGKKLFYMLVAVGGEKILFILECTEVFIASILRSMNPTIWEKKLK